MQILKLKGNKAKVISVAIKTLNAGGIIIYPTETCYGLGVDATNQDAVNKLISYKTFRDDKPISVAVTDRKMAEKYVKLNATAKNLYKEYLPGPFTIVSKGKGKVANGVESNTKTLGVRIPKYDFMLELTKVFGKPITATSANVSYKKTPYCVKDILTHTSEKQQALIDLIIDAGKLPKNDPSTVIDTTLDDVNILRQGDIVIRHKHKVITHGEEETRVFGEKLIKNLIEKKLDIPIIIAFQGELGTGKTQMSKGMALALGIKQEITSPTYIISREYKLKKNFVKFVHMDIYKLMEGKEIWDVGLAEMLEEKSLIVIEWAEKVSEIIKDLKGKAFVVWINMYHKSENERIIEYGEFE
ncbi:MAG: threonylcarbamoyl-AMP synthase [Candidatus Diapherotrites archaeon]|nr:threonylcarbamoyl-AMP synthase [Candidatus Diapherotrites archaeon]MBT4596750.1 threonylcarbamoyl-AMP synthase [Candidatus Diapherotrites archaeon]